MARAIDLSDGGVVMGMSWEVMGKELARQIDALSALKEERKETLSGFKMREQGILKEMFRLALDMRTGQSSLYPAVEKERG